MHRWKGPRERVELNSGNGPRKRVLNSGEYKAVAQKVYMLWFVQEQDDCEDIELLIGVYENEGEAKTAIERHRDKPGFVDFPQGFQIHERELGVEGWTEGFIRD